jgi:DNA adenine methylase
MTKDDHEELLDALEKHPGPVILSGYSHPLYDDRLKHWRRETKRAKAEAGAIREEVLWINPVASEHGFIQESLFN